MGAPLNELGAFVFYRTYSRFLPEQQRRESWAEMNRRACEYNVGLALKHLEKIGLPVDREWYRREAEELYAAMFATEQFLSGRTMWVGGAEGGVADKYPLANFNCSFLNIRSWDDLGDLFYLLLVGTGVGFKITKDFAAGLAPIRTDVEVVPLPYEPLPSFMRRENTDFDFVQDQAIIRVGDSKEGWVTALRDFLSVLTSESFSAVKRILIDFNSVRPNGERLKTFGGTASGPEPLREMFEGFVRVLRNEVDPHLAPLERAEDPRYARVRPIHVVDMANMVGYNVVVGGVRRTAEIALFDADDFECILAKYGINGLWGDEAFEEHEVVRQKLIANGIEVPAWFDELAVKHYDVTVDGTHVHKFNNLVDARKFFEMTADDGYDVMISGAYNPGRPFHHRRMSNNSIAFVEKPTRSFLNLIQTIMKREGEPGYVNLRAAAIRRLRGQGIYEPSEALIAATIVEIGLNPCAEILLATYGVCNLTTVNLVAFVKQRADGSYYLDSHSLIEAQKRSARAGLRMTLVDLELPHWSATQQRDRLLGCSLTGVKDAMGLLGWDDEQEAELLAHLGAVARAEADEYARQLRIPAPLLVTTVKPEGTLSQVAGGVSSGLHYSHSPYYTRRIRINAADPLAKVALDLGWTVNPEVGTPGDTHEERMSAARTLVIDFPIKSGATKTKDDVGVREQFATYFRFQDEYTEHNSSNTIHVRPHEWDIVEEIVYENFDVYVGLSFLAHDGGTYQLAPYEAITAEQYEAMKAQMKPFDPALLAKYESSTGEDLDIGADGCEAGVCPIR